MAEKPTEKTFAQFLEEQPAPAETVTLTGHAARSARPGSFSFFAAGQTMELPTDAVKRHKVVSEGPQRLVEIEIFVSKIDPRILKSVPADGIKHPNADPVTFKEVTTDLLADKPAFKDPIVDPVSLIEPAAEPGFAADPAPGAQPFVLATPHHAPASAIAGQMGGPAARMVSMPLSDPATAFYFDRAHTLKELVKDPVYDYQTLPQSVFPDPAGQSEMLRLGAAPVSGILSVAYLDQPHTAIWLDRISTLKEIAKDPITDVYTVVETLPGGGGGTLAEGVAGGGPAVNPVWNLPGMMF